MDRTQPNFRGCIARRVLRSIAVRDAAACPASGGALSTGGKGQKPAGLRPGPGGSAAIRDNHPAKPLAVASLCARFRIQQRLAAHTPEMHRAKPEGWGLRRCASCRPTAPGEDRPCADFRNRSMSEGPPGYRRAFQRVKKTFLTRWQTSRKRRRQATRIRRRMWIR